MIMFAMLLKLINGKRETQLKHYVFVLKIIIQNKNKINP